MCAQFDTGGKSEGGCQRNIMALGNETDGLVFCRTTVVVLATPPPSSHIQRKHTRLPLRPKKELYFPRFSSGFDLGRVRFNSFFLIRVIARRHSSLHYRHNNRKDWIRGKKRLRGKRFSHESLYECSFPRLQCPTEKRKKPFSSRLVGGCGAMGENEEFQERVPA